MRAVKFFLFFFWGFLFSQAIACTHFEIKAGDGTIMIARTLEFGPNLESNIVSVPKGTDFKTTAPDGNAGISWKAKYGYVYLDGFHLVAVDGMNEKGLSFGALYFPDKIQYQTVSTGEDKNALPYYEFGHWILGNFDSVDQVRAALPKLKVFAKALNVQGKSVTFPLHYVISDATGQSIVVEFVDGKMNVYNNKLGVFTNSPSYPWQITNLRNYVNLSPYSPVAVKVDGIEYAATGQGSGMLGLPGDTTPPSRFVKAAFLVKTAQAVPDAAGALNLAAHIMNNFDIPLGLVRGVKGDDSPLESTQWVIFKDLVHHVLYFKSYDNLTLQSIHLDKINFASGAPQFKMPVTSQQMTKDVTSQFIHSK